jgi:hypothetical protein
LKPVVICRTSIIPNALPSAALLFLTMADPLMTLLAGALKLWIRTRCDQLGSLELTLHGSAFTLMSGRLQGVSLIARDVGFKGLPLQHVQLRSGPITVDLNVLSPGQMLALQHPFQVEGEVSISGTALNDALLAEPWRWLGDSLAEQLMGLTTLGGLTIENDVMELQSAVVAHREPVRRCFRIDASDNTLRFRSQDAADASSMLLPMDPGIKITMASLQGGQLHLNGCADVTP